MSGTANEFENPGGNYPDREDSPGTQPDQSQMRENDVVGGAVHPDAAAADADSDVPADATPATPAEGPPEAKTGTADGPLLAQNQASTTDQIDGILAQTHADLGSESENRYAEVLRQRFEDASIDLTDEQILDLARRAGATAADGSSGGTSGV
jgi:hypothetical protein